MEGCQAVKSIGINFEKLKEKYYPEVQLSIFIDQPTPFLAEALENIANLDYPKDKIDLYLYFHDGYHEADVDSFMYSNARKYKSYTVKDPAHKLSSSQARDAALRRCATKMCQYYFAVEGHVQLTNPNTLKDLISLNRSVVAPLITRYGKYWSNFWGNLGSDGYYRSSFDYPEIVENRKRCIWNVPLIRDVYLIRGSLASQLQGLYTHAEEDSLSFEMAFAKNLREKGIFMYVSNMDVYGDLVNSDNYNTSHFHNDLWEIIRNKHNWEKRYLHKNYSSSLQPGAVIESPCPDVAWFPVVTEKFCDHLVEEMEHYGKWSDGKHEATSLMNFVVRYRPDEQPLLEPHHDISTWTINIALNTPGIDFTGGGCRFIRQNCTVGSTRKGWMLMHPGRLTHFHEGLRVTSGTRYIMISFVNP